MRLFKYHTVNKNSISCLVNGFVWFSSPGDFNDPYDTAVIDNDFLRSINFNNEKIFCLSAKNDSFLMWSHYCDSHRGFCVEFTDYSDEEIIGLKERGIFPKDAANNNLTTVRCAKPVQYKSTDEINQHVNSFPVDEDNFRRYFEDHKQRGKEKELVSLIHNSSFIKHTDWAYEEEYRIINITKNIVHPPGRVTAVYFGIKMSSLDKRCIGMIVDPNLKGHCKLYQMYRQKGTYSFLARPFNPETDLEGIEIKY